MPNKSKQYSRKALDRMWAAYEKTHGPVSDNAKLLAESMLALEMKENA